MSRFAKSIDYHRGTLRARNRIARILRVLIQDSGSFMADVDRYAGWWPGRTGRITSQVPEDEQEPQGDSRYHTTIEDVLEIGRFLEMDAATTLHLVAECLEAAEEGVLPERRPLSDQELEEIGEDIRRLGERVARRLEDSESEPRQKSGA